MLTTEQVPHVLGYWYGGTPSAWDRQPGTSLSKHPFWWQGGPEMDAHVAAEYGALHKAVVASPDPVVAAGQSRRELAEPVIILSQFTRHIHRGQWTKEISRRRLAHSNARAFENDGKARKIAKWMTAEDWPVVLFRHPPACGALQDCGRSEADRGRSSRESRERPARASLLGS